MSRHLFVGGIFGLAAFGLIPWLAFVFVLGLLHQLYVGMHNFYLLLRARAAS